ncbi:MAG TPA: thiamine pyrophosphate-binding protein [Streptosporangiaceae bacterium]|jgi:sulfopyruvate decarboxylase alpha subunit
MTTATRVPLRWQTDMVTRMVAGGVSVAAFVPDSRLDQVLTGLGEADVPLRSLTREEECVAYAAGQRIGGGRPVVLMQSSGIGNALNALGTLAVPYRLGVPLVVSMRGTLGETNPSQIPIGRAATTLLGALGIQCFPLRRPEDAAGLTKAVLDMAYEAGETAALILEPELGGQRERH